MTTSPQPPAPQKQQSLVGTTEVAKRLGMSREQVWKLWTTGRLPGYKLDRHLRFSQTDIDQFLIRHYSGTPEPEKRTTRTAYTRL